MPICTLQLKRFRTDSPTLTLPSVNSQGTEWKIIFKPRRVCQALPPADRTTPGGLNLVLALLVRSNLEKMGHIWKQAIKRVRPGLMSSPWRNWYLLSQRQVTDMGHQDVLQTPHSAVSWKAGQLCLSAHRDQGWDPECDRFRSKIKQSILTTEPQKNELVFFFLAALYSTQNLNSLTRDWIWAPALKARSPDHWTAKEFPKMNI